MGFGLRASGSRETQTNVIQPSQLTSRHTPISTPLPTPQSYTTETKSVSFFKAPQKSFPSSSTAPPPVQQPTHWKDRAKGIFVSTPDKPSKLSGVRKKIREKAVLIRDVLISHNTNKPPIQFTPIDPPVPTIADPQPPPIQHKFVSQQIVSIKDIEPALEWDDGESVSFAPTVSVSMLIDVGQLWLNNLPSISKALPPRIRVALSTLTEESDEDEDEDDDEDEDPDDPLVDAVVVRVQNPTGSIVTRSRVSPPWMNKGLPSPSLSSRLSNLVLSGGAPTPTAADFDIKRDSAYPETLLGSEIDDEESVFLVPLRSPTRVSVISSLVDRLSVHSIDQTVSTQSDAGTNISSRSSAIVMLPYSPLVRPSMGLLGPNDVTYHYGGPEASGLASRRMSRRGSAFDELRKSAAPSFSEFGNPYDAEDLQARHSAMMVLRPISPSNAYSVTESPRIPSSKLRPFTPPVTGLRSLSPVDHNIRHSQVQKRASFLLASQDNAEKRFSNTSARSNDTPRAGTPKRDSKLKERSGLDKRRSSIDESQKVIKPSTPTKKDRTSKLGTPTKSGSPPRSAEQSATSKPKKVPKPLTPAQQNQYGDDPPQSRRSSRGGPKAATAKRPTSPVERHSVSYKHRSKVPQDLRSSLVRSPSPRSSPTPSPQPLKPHRASSTQASTRQNTARKDRVVGDISSTYIKPGPPSVKPPLDRLDIQERPKSTPDKSKTSPITPTSTRHHSIVTDKPLPSLPSKAAPPPSPMSFSVRRKEPPPMPLGRSRTDIVTPVQNRSQTELGRSRTFSPVQTPQNAEFLQSSGKAFAGQAYKCIQVFDADDGRTEVWLDSHKTTNRTTTNTALLVPSVLYNRPR
ncbi:hypothetical protein FRC02_004150 [Tulasnella sp. 418]|nr:hypothetical protein FRC02_004150 [Tulasnella sp. 418]